MERVARLIRNSQSSAKIISDEDIARAIWPAAVGKTIAAHTLRLKLVRTTLIVEVEDSVWQKQLHPLTDQIVDRLRRVLGADLVRDIEFKVGAPRRPPMRTATPNPNPALDADEAETIRDPVLKKVYRLSRKKATA